MSPTNCPSCGHSLRGEKIAAEDRELFGEAEYFSRGIGIYSIEKDRVVRWRCPDCGHEWERETRLTHAGGPL